MDRGFCRWRVGCLIALTMAVTDEPDILDSSVRPSLFQSFHGSGLGAGHARIHTAFRECPAASARLHEKEFDLGAQEAVANRCDQFPLRHSKRSCIRR